MMLVLTFWGVLVDRQHTEVEQQSIMGSEVDSSAQGNYRKPDEAGHTFEMFSWDLFSTMLSS